MVKKRKAHRMEYFDKEKKKWIKVAMGEVVDEKVMHMHDFVVAQIEIMTTIEEMNTGLSPEKN